MKKILASVLATATTTTALVAAPLVASPAQADPVQESQAKLTIDFDGAKHLKKSKKTRVTIDVELEAARFANEPADTDGNAYDSETTYKSPTLLTLTGPKGSEAVTKKISATRDSYWGAMKIDVPSLQKPRAKLTFTVRATGNGFNLTKTKTFRMSSKPKAKARFLPRTRVFCGGQWTTYPAQLNLQYENPKVKAPGAKKFKTQRSHLVIVKRAGTYRYKVRNMAYDWEFQRFYTPYSKTKKIKVTKKMLKKVKTYRSVTTRACG